MNKSKAEFISELLTEKRISVTEKERLFQLTKAELLKTNLDRGNEIKEIKKRVGKLEEEVGLASDISKTEKKTNNFPPNFKSQPKPQDTHLFLSLFSNSLGLKYLTHPFNSEKPDYDEFMKICKEEFNNAESKYPNTNSTLLKRLKEFAFSAKPSWYIRKGDKKEIINWSWSETSFIEWYKKPQNIHPWLDEEWKEKMIKVFKESIEIKAISPKKRYSNANNLHEIIDQSLKYSLGKSIDNFEIKMDDNLYSAEFYTDVNEFQQALFRIFSTIKDMADKNLEFGISIYYKNEKLESGIFKKVIITHIGSEPTKKANDPDFDKGDLKSIQSKLWSLCNYEIEAKFTDGCYRRIFLTDDINEYKEYVQKVTPIKIKRADGFSHILKFY